MGKLDVLLISRTIPTEEDDKTTERDGMTEALMVACSPAGSFKAQPRGRIFDSWGFSKIGDGVEIDMGLEGSVDGRIAVECNGWNKAVCTNEVAAEPET